MIQVMLTAYGSKDFEPASELGRIVMYQDLTFDGASREAARMDRVEFHQHELSARRAFVRSLNALGHDPYLRVTLRFQP